MKKAAEDGKPVLRTWKEVVSFLKKHPTCALNPEDSLVVSVTESVSSGDYLASVPLSLWLSKKDTYGKYGLVLRTLNTLSYGSGEFLILESSPLGFGNSKAKNFGLPVGVRVGDIVPGLKVTVRFLDSPVDMQAVVIERDAVSNKTKYADCRIIFRDPSGKVLQQSAELCQIMAVHGMVL